MAYGIVNGLATGAIVAIAPVAAFLLWRSTVWWMLPILAAGFIAMVAVGVGDALGARWARVLARILAIR
ncbi:MAG: hypothetical protein N2441_09060 [Rhodocyclaceae bacterium]|nr:hypothetical protein [Rhodocyclaceae bacterium]